MKRLVSLGLAGLFASGFAMADDASVQESLRVKWIAAYNTGDVEALSSMYAADAQLQQGYCPLVVGRDAIETFWRDDIGDGSAQTQLEIEDMVSTDELVYLRGSYAVEIANAPVVRRVGGTYTQIWRHEQATGWTIHRETWTNFACAEVRVEPPSGDAEVDAALEPRTAI